MAMTRVVRLIPKTKHRFTEEEDNFILRMVNELGIHEWNLIAERLGTRTARQCRERWRHYLHPVIDIAPWSLEEDALLEEQYKQIGPKWSQISAMFHGRTEVNLKNRWTRLHRHRNKHSEPSHPDNPGASPDVSGPLGEIQFEFPRAVQSIGKYFSPIESLLPAPDKRFPTNSFLDLIIRMPDRL
jgi:hypothetical protein